MTGRCSYCGSTGKTISNVIGACVDCIRSKGYESLEQVHRTRRKWRLRLGLPPEPPRSGKGSCRLCVNECSPMPGELGYCGLWIGNKKGVSPANKEGVFISYYHDPHPTNCVAAHLCPATTSRGYPYYTSVKGVEYGKANLAVFAYGCTLDCLFCQNYTHKTRLDDVRAGKRTLSIEDLVTEAMDPRITCVCYFGGDPTPQMPLILKASREILERSREAGVIKRICWETNGLQNPAIMRRMAELSLASGGIVKIDWKAWTPSVYEALTGVRGDKAIKRLIENTTLLTKLASERPDPPLLVVSILLVPGYVDYHEVRGIAGHLAGLDPQPPVVLLAFHPDYLLNDLPPTSNSHALDAVRALREAGIIEYYIGNQWILGDYY